MSGERSDRLVQMAALGAARLARRMALVSERFGASPAAEMRELRLEDAMRELDEVGHLYSDACDRPFCLTARAMLQQAVAVVQGENGTV